MPREIVRLVFRCLQELRCKSKKAEIIKKKQKDTDEVKGEEKEIKTESKEVGSFGLVSKQLIK